MTISKANFHQSAGRVTEKLMAALQAEASRKAFFRTLSQTLQEYFHFDRLCINLYDKDGDMLTYFTAAEGTLVSTLSPVRPAESASTVAGHVIASRKPIIITDFAEHFPESQVHPIAEAGLNSTMAFPLILDSEIIATLHCSFADKPDNMYEIATFITDICPAVAISLGSILSHERLELRRGGQPHAAPHPPGGGVFVYHSTVMRDIMRQVEANARLNVSILLLGESGTGKTAIAHEIHRRSPRRDAAFVKVSCPSLSTSLFESELFGHTRGAFTGAGAKRTGRVEMAHGGTLFLDEIAELSGDMQAKLLQVLDESSFERVGESVPVTVDARFLAATNVDVATAIARGTLRHDLFYRLATCVIEIPPLRRHKEDIPTLVSVIARQASGRLGLAIPRFNRSLIGMLMDYDWPGNIRELRNIVTRLSIINGMHGEITAADVRLALRETHRQEELAGGLGRDMPARPASGPGGEEDPAHGEEPARLRLDTLAEAERKHIIRALTMTGGLIGGSEGAAALLGLPRGTLQHRMRKLGITIRRGARVD